jgi:hypothetical protein
VSVALVYPSSLFVDEGSPPGTLQWPTLTAKRTAQFIIQQRQFRIGTD